MEWTESQSEFNSPHAQSHRHVNHLVGFYPGTSIANGDAANLQAMVDTLNWKGDAATGWSMGWKINLWARTGQGNRAYNLIQNLFKYNLAKNMFDLHSGIGFSTDNYYFQIDGNFGYTSGVQEMLLHSHLGTIDLLPALPDAWERGSFSGLRSIGGHEIAAEWENKQLKKAVIKAFTDGGITVRNGPLSIVIPAEKGASYVITVKNGELVVAYYRGQKK
jgi:alpha-L-fucosidase 2